MLMLIYTLVVVSVFSEFALTISLDSKSIVRSKISAIVLGFLNTFSISYLLIYELGLISGFLALLAVFRVLNLARILENRMHIKE